jgi:hypothetical protein
MLDRPIVPATIVLAAAVGFSLVRLFVAGDGSVSHFVMAATPYANNAKVPPSLHLVPVGYDGQFYYRLALNPTDLHRTAYGITLDVPFRLERIGYPVLAWALAFGQFSLVPWSLLIVNVLALVGIGFLGGVFARDAGRHALWGLLVPGFFGYLVSLGRNLSEPTAAVFLLAGLLAYRRKHPVLAGALLAYASVSRETVMVAVAALAIVRLLDILRRRSGPGWPDAAWLIPAVAFFGWQLLVRAVIGTFPLSSDLHDNSGRPLAALFHAVKNNVSQISVHHAAVDEWVVEMAVLAVFVAVAAWSLGRTTIPAHEQLAFVLYALEACTLSGFVWNEHADLRTLNEVYTFAVLILLGTRRSLKPFAVLLVIPLAIVAFHRMVAL